MNHEEKSIFDSEDSSALYLKMVETSIAPSKGYSDFRHFIKAYVRPLLPHGMLMAVIGRVTFDHISLEQLVPVDYPESFMERIGHSANLGDRPVVAYWLATKKPLLIDPVKCRSFLSELEYSEISEFGLGNLAIHGQIDMSGRMASYFSFAQVPVLLPTYSRLLELMAPHLHVALLNAHAAETTAKEKPNLSAKELEILRWMVAGRTNREIARILNKSEMTVRNQVHVILSKLGAANRSEALGIADDFGFLGFGCLKADGSFDP